MMSAHGTLEGCECAFGSLVVRLRLRTWLLFLLQMLLKLRHGQAVEAPNHVTMLQSAAVKAWTVRVVALAYDLPATNDDAAMTEVEMRHIGLLKAQGEIGISTERHLEILEKRF